MSQQKIKVLFGAFPMNSYSEEEIKEFFDLFEQYGIKEIDTARGYKNSEKRLGEFEAPKKYVIHTKASFEAGLKKQQVLKSMQESLADLGVDSVNTYFLHEPDRDTPIEETMEAIQELYQAGKFKHFGLSNFSTEEVRQVHAYAKSKGYVVPDVYQGNYNPVARKAEATLLPLLRELGIAFYAYSPLAGGFLTKTPASLEAGGPGRFDKETFAGQMYHKLYNRGPLVDVLVEWENIANAANASKAALAYRWVMFNSALKTQYEDGIILGASRPKQLKETLGALEAGPLEKDIADRIERIWEKVKDVAPMDNFSF